MHSRGISPFMAKCSAFNPYRILRREQGCTNPIGAADAVARSLYCGLKPIASWSADESNNVLTTGGIFNLEFSPEGNLLVAACEKKCVQLFDPLTHKNIHSVNGAHSDCVNCVKFLDGRMFATCSDDTTIALWDIRNLKKNIRSLQGHSNWVKNIEFSVKDKLLVTSGLDGSIYTWDINSYTECNLIYQRVFHASGLMRCRLSPDAKQMVMCTTGGLLVIIHDLDLATLAHDLHGFKPNLYRLMQMSQQLIPIAAMYDHLFDPTRKQNRVEFVTDFPDGNDAKVISSLQIHPQGWSALSRNISHDDRSEWSCIHDIQSQPASNKSVMDRCPSPPVVYTRRTLRRRRPRLHTASYSTRSQASRNAESSESSSAMEQDSPQPSAPEPSSERVASPPEAPSTSRAPAEDIRPAPGATTDVWEASITVKQHRVLQDMLTRGQVGRNFNMQRISGITTGITPPAEPPSLNSLIARERQEGMLRISPSSSGQTPSSSNSVVERTSDEQPERPEHYIRQNKERLLYYTEEPNEGKGFIKELCFSSDGRLVCSPFGRGMRLLAFNATCSELPDIAPYLRPPAVMTVLGESTGYHRDLVVCSKFSPRHHLLVTGCLDGKIVWYQPFSGESILNMYK